LAESVRKTGKLLTIEEHSVVGGFAGACTEAHARKGLTYTLDAIGIEDCFLLPGL